MVPERLRPAFQRMWCAFAPADSGNGKSETGDREREPQMPRDELKPRQFTAFEKDLDDSPVPVTSGG